MMCVSLSLSQSYVVCMSAGNSMWVWLMFMLRGGCNNTEGNMYAESSMHKYIRYAQDQPKREK